MTPRNTAVALAPPVSPVAPTSLRPLAPGAGRITGGFWALRQERNRRDALRAGHRQLEESGTLDNFRIAAGAATGEARGMIFQDSDAYKWLEAVGYELGRGEDAELRGLLEEVTAIVAAAQQEDGYLNAVHQLRHSPEERYSNLAWNHELYCYGHLFQAAVAVSRSAGEDSLLEVSLRILDHLGEVFAPGAHQGVPGHPEIEMALVELFRLTGRRDALDLARHLTDARGRNANAISNPGYFSDRVPVRETETVEGHAVRALYLAAGATDLAIEDGDADLLEHLRSLFTTALHTKAYVTGGMGSRWDWEAFGDPFELSTDRGYAETCAGIAAVQWAWRLLLATGDPVYADAIERFLFNAVLPGVSLAGTEFFYVNSLQLRDGAIADEGRSIVHGRRGWFDCACCPPNVMRTLSALDQYLATADEAGLQLHQYASGTWAGGGLEIAVETEYPHRGRVRILVLAAPEEPRTLSLRVPAWAEGATVTTAEGEREARPGTLPLQRVFVPGEKIVLDLPMTARFVRAPHRADASRGAVALERGPLVYALEQADQQGTERVDDALVDPAAPVAEQVLEDLDGVVALDLPGAAAAAPEDGVSYLPWDAPSAAPTPHAWRAIPYYAWANREIGPMRVWLPVAPRG
ncbi:beta-L-arabinofuranosidase domain-containing protein [Brachybacterium sp. J144]|uniref:glycoside hydrolase family 127 protein n=1 Tax=Brachybacterium sp. J144 TaxID=3116487 RepID=UPI002E76AA17|nr:beta-L-arabinofuranosidase domain-containing protein [Brachybacterium sp. J144]MEE1649891.1 beta-L-arabinofuranosidase domain-containing protein [Brachybacterium sp. J144]